MEFLTNEPEVNVENTVESAAERATEITEQVAAENAVETVAENTTENTLETLTETAEREEKLPLAFPQTDYKKDGSVKKVRGRVLKKLLKYEYRSYAPTFYILLSVLGALTLLICLFIRFDVDVPNESFKLAQAISVFMALGFALYLFTLFLFPFVMYALSIRRYEANFFKDEGYLTFSVPASMQEHTLAKHICGMAITAAATLASFISLLLFLTVSFDTSINITPSQDANFLLKLESYLLTLCGFVSTFFIIGAGICWSQKFTQKRAIFFRFLIVYFVIVLLESAFTMFDFTAIRNFFASKAGAHVSIWLGIVISAGAGYLSYRYEVKYLTSRLNLK